VWLGADGHMHSFLRKKLNIAKANSDKSNKNPEYFDGMSYPYLRGAALYYEVAFNATIIFLIFV